MKHASLLNEVEPIRQEKSKARTFRTVVGCNEERVGRRHQRRLRRPQRADVRRRGRLRGARVWLMEVQVADLRCGQSSKSRNMDRRHLKECGHTQAHGHLERVR